MVREELGRDKLKGRAGMKARKKSWWKVEVEACERILGEHKRKGKERKGNRRVVGREKAVYGREGLEDGGI